MNEGDEYICKVTILGDFEKTSKLVKCKDCIYYDRKEEDCGMMMCYDWNFSPEGYCSYGIERWGEND